MDKLTKQEFYDKLQALINEIDLKIGNGKQGIFNASFPSESERKLWNKKYWDLVSGGRGINNAEFFYNRIKETYSRVLQMDALTPIAKTDREMLEEINNKLDIILGKNIFK